MKGGRVFRKMGIKEGRERVSNVTRIITKLNDDLTVHPLYLTLYLFLTLSLSLATNFLLRFEKHTL